MRIALVTDGITPYVTGGMQRHSFNLCRALVKHGVAVDLYHCDPNKRGAASLDCFTTEERAQINAELIEFPSFGKMPGHYIRESYEYSRRISNKLFRKPAPDFIYAKGFTAWELLNLKAKGKQLPPIGVNLHGYEMFQKLPGFKARLEAALFLRSPARFMVKHADYLFSYGGQITDVIRSLGVEDKRIVSIPGGIGSEWITDRAQPAQSPVRLLFAGRAERRKGIEELNACVRQLMNTHAGKFTFSFLGPIPYSARIKGCQYHGELNDADEIRKVYRSNDVLCVPSYSEGMPNVILEAMASGLAILATDVGAVSAIVNEENGWLIASPERETLRIALEKIIGLPAVEVSAKKAISLDKVRNNFSWEKIGQQTLDFIRTAASA
jgi:glycosyltransferase involved in cell wall biosynthesis